MFDSEKFNGFVRKKLDDLLFDDIWNYWVFNESDLHSAAFFYIRKYFQRKDSASAGEVFVRCEPRMEDGSKPDIVVFKKYDPIYILELKMFKKPEEINEDKVGKDLDKLKSYITRYPTIKWGFQIVVYDSEEMFKPSSYLLRKAGYEKISVSTINMRRKEENERHRSKYDDWRKQFDKYLERHL